MACQRAVRLVNPSSVRWFPGHMRKGMDQMHLKLSSVDILIEIHDARIPFTGRCSLIKKFGSIRPHILLLNKMDLAEEVPDMDTYRSELSDHANSLSENLIAIYLTQLNSPERQKRLLRRLIRGMTELATQPDSFANRSEEFSVSGHHFSDSPLASQQSILGMAVGIPNSGKSTLINALRGVGLGGSGGAARVGRFAGQTRSVGQPIIIHRGSSRSFDSASADRISSNSYLDDVRVMILDTPGILEPRVQSLTQQLSLCVCGSLDWDVVDKNLLVDYLLFWWNYRRRTDYVSVLNLPNPTDNVTELLARVCAENAFFLKYDAKHRGPSWLASEVESLNSNSFHSNPVNLPDLNRAAEHILRLFNKGVFGRTTFLPDDEQAAAHYFVPITK